MLNPNGAQYTSAGTDGTNSFATSGSVIIAGTSRNNTPLVISTDSGASWSNTSLLGVSGTAVSVQIYSMAVTTTNGITTWYVVLSSDMGANWQNINTGLTASSYPALIVSNNILLAGAHSSNEIYGTPLTNSFVLSTYASTWWGRLQ